MAKGSLRRFWHSLMPRSIKNQRLQQVDDRVFFQKQHACPDCGSDLDSQRLLDNSYVCYECSHHFRLSANERLRTICDGGEYQEFAMGITSKDPLEFPDYPSKIKKAQDKTGLDDAIKTVFCSINGHRSVVMVMDFNFMGGSMGSVVGEKLTRGLLTAAQNQLPCILFTASGGARMQEGIHSLMQMGKTSHAIALLEEAGMPFFVVVTDPTTGGVTASFAMLGDVTLTEPGALIGFTGARVIQDTIRQKLPPGFQRAEFQLEKGFVDAIVPRQKMKDTLSYLIETHVVEAGGK